LEGVPPQPVSVKTAVIPKDSNARVHRGRLIRGRVLDWGLVMVLILAR
jgi:hypothetical protein